MLGLDAFRDDALAETMAETDDRFDDFL